METRSLIVLAAWISLSIVSVVFVWIGGANLWNYIFVGLLIFLALGITVVVGFGLAEEEWKQKRKPETELLNQLRNIEERMDRLTKMVEEIKKALEE